MDPNNIHEHHQSRDEIEPGELFEDSWFFSNLLRRKPRMLRSYSDPCSSSYEETYESIKKLPEKDGFTRSNLVKAPLRVEIQDQNHTAKGRSKSSEKLVRAPSLPTSLRTEEFEDEEEIEFSMGKLIRQASLNCSDHNLIPTTQATTVLSPSSSSSISRRKPELESENLEEKTPPQLPNNHQLKTQKSSELQCLKDFRFDLNQNVININQGPRRADDMWRVTSSAPPVPRWVGKKSREDMIKVQIKFWARAVASNVRQEC